MKRLLVLFIVFALTSAAGAALSFYIDGSPAPSLIFVGPGETVTIQIHSDNTSNWLGYAVMQDTGDPDSMWGSLGSGHTYKGTDYGPDGGNAGENGGNVYYTESGWAASGYEFTTLSISGQVVAGIQHEMVYTGGFDFGMAYIGLFAPPLYTWDADELDRIQVNPEPATISLLGLGGAIVLMRKRRT